jgi:hypothetical protein
MAANPALPQTPPPDVEAPEGPQPAIPPGREQMLSAMLGAGATLPGGCRFAGGGVKHSAVEATYSCADGQVVFELAHPSRAAAPAALTEKFAITAKQGAPPAELMAALAERIRAQEGDFEWTWMGSSAASEGEQTTGWILELALIALVAIGVLGWTLRRRARAVAS